MKKIYIFGVGLIGGSIALKTRDLNIFDEIIGIGRPGGSSLDKLVRSGVLNSSLTQIGKEIGEANLIVIATPVAQTKIILKEIPKFINIADKNTVKDRGNYQVHREFILFETSQCYPEFVVTFKPR